MAMFLPKYWSLGLLRVSLDSTPTIPEVTCKIVVRHDRTEHVAVDEKFTIDEFDAQSVPTRLVEALEAWAVGGADENSLLWVHLVEPYGALGGVAWEQLQFQTGIPVLRLPDVLPSQAPPQGLLDVAVCASAPSIDSDIIEMIHESLEIFEATQSLKSNVRTHFFVDKEWRCMLERKLDLVADDSETWVVYDREPESSPGDDTNPWLDWILRTSYQQNYDMVHFLCHGCLSGYGDSGVLALAGSPDENYSSYASHIPASRILDLLDNVGAYGVGFTAPLTNLSMAGMRLVADAVGVSRAGPVVMHDRARGRTEHLPLAYKLILGEQDFPMDINASLLFYVQPELVLATNQSYGHEPNYGYKLESAPEDIVTTPAVDKSQGVAPWASILSRYIHSKQLELNKYRQAEIEGSLDADGRAYAKGIRKALQHIDKVVRSYKGVA